LNLLKNKDKIPIVISIISLAVSTILGINTLNLYASQNSLSQALYELQVANMRANMSILINPQFDQQWTFVADGVFLTVNGTLVNEGSREALVRRMDLSVTYHFSDGTPYTVTVGYSDIPKWCELNNTVIREKEEAPFSIGIFVHSSIVAIIGGTYTSHTMQSLSIGNSRSDNFTVAVTYFDGISDLQSEKEFSTKEG